MSASFKPRARFPRMNPISARLETHRSLEWSQRDYAIRLAGHRPADLFRNSAVMDWTRAYLGGLRGAGGFTSDEAANILQKDVPEGMDAYEFERRLESVVRETPSIVEGHALLKGLVAAEVADLTERRELIGLREGRDRGRAIEVAKVDLGADAVKRSRYEAMSDRAQHAALRQLRALKQERRKYGEEGSEGLDESERPAASEPGQAAQDEATAVAAAPAQNEATAAQVDGRTGAESPCRNPGGRDDDQTGIGMGVGTGSGEASPSRDGQSRRAERWRPRRGSPRGRRRCPAIASSRNQPAENCSGWRPRRRRKTKWAMWELTTRGFSS